MTYETATYKKTKATGIKDNVPQLLIVHHTGGTDANPLADTSNHSAKTVENYHLSLGWEGIGYHYYIAKNGDLSLGRPDTYHGGHAGPAWNKKSIGICLAGNFDATLPTEAQVATLKALLELLSEKWGIAPENIVPHRHVATKTCYGNFLSEDWARSLLKEVEVAKPDEKLAACEAEVIEYEKKEVEYKSVLDILINFIKNKLS